MIKLEDVLTDEEIRRLSNETRGTFAWVRACIALAVEKAEKVSGFVGGSIGMVRGGRQTEAGREFTFYSNVRLPGYRHALLLLGPRYEPKPLKSAEELRQEALDFHNRNCDCGEQRSSFTGCSMARILRGDGDGR